MGQDQTWDESVFQGRAILEDFIAIPILRDQKSPENFIGRISTTTKLQILNSRNEFIDEELKIKDREIGEMKRKILYNEEALDAMKKQNELLTEEYKKLDLQWNEELIETKRVKDTENIS